MRSRGQRLSGTALSACPAGEGEGHGTPPQGRVPRLSSYLKNRARGVSTLAWSRQKLARAGSFKTQNFPSTRSRYRELGALTGNCRFVTSRLGASRGPFLQSASGACGSRRTCPAQARGPQLRRLPRRSGARARSANRVLARPPPPR